MTQTAVIERPLPGETATVPLTASLPMTLRPRQDRRDAQAWAIGALALVAAIVLWSADDGGYGTVVWLPSTIALLAVGAWLRLVFGPPQPLGSASRLALAALGAYVAWSFLSITWAVDKGTALLGSDRALLYLIIFGLALQLHWDFRRLQLAQLVYLSALGVIGAVTLTRLLSGSGAALLQNGELADPGGYHNATAALGTIGTLTGVLLLSSTQLRPWVRALCAASASVCLELSLLAVSRGWLYTLPLIALVILAIAPRRRRLLAWALMPVLGAAATLPWLLHAQRVASLSSGAAGERLVAHADVAVAAVGLAAALLAAAVAYLLARVEEHYTLGPAGQRLARFTAIAAALGASAITVTAIVIAAADGALARGWHQFASDAPVRAGESRFIQLGSGRYDFWRVAIDDFLAHPLGGLGQDNFAQSYTAARHTTEEPAWVHSLELRLLAHTGAVGFVLFTAFLVLATAVVLRLRRRPSASAALLLAGALAPLSVWVIHGSVDWFWEFPALSGPAFMFLGAALALANRTGTAEPAPGAASLPPSQALVPFTPPPLITRLLRHPRGNRRAIRLATNTLLVAAALFALVPACLGELELQRARAVSASDTGAALADLHKAAQYEPLSDTPQLIAGALLLNAGRDNAALSQLRTGIAHDPGSWLLWLERGLAADGAGAADGADATTATGRPQAGSNDLRRAHALDPREPVIAEAIRRAHTDTPLTISQAAAIFNARGAALIGQ